MNVSDQRSSNQQRLLDPKPLMHHFYPTEGRLSVIFSGQPDNIHHVTLNPFSVMLQPYFK